MPKLIDNPTLPKNVFGVEANPALMAQAVRVHLVNQRQGTQNAKTRAEINRTRLKYQKQKGSGNARHGDRKAPIFVGGGVSFAPKPRDFNLKLPKKMRRLALFSALSSKAKDKTIHVVSGLSDLSGKTKEAASFLANLPTPTKKLLVVISDSQENIVRALQNISQVTVIPVALLNTYEVLRASKILIMSEAINLLGKPADFAPEESPVKKTAHSRPKTNKKVK